MTLANQQQENVLNICNTGAKIIELHPTNRENLSFKTNEMKFFYRELQMFYSHRG